MKNTSKLLGNTFLIVLAILLLVRLGDHLEEQRIDGQVNWENSIENPDNQPFVLECAFNLGVHPDSVTQAQFDERYLK